MGHRSPANAATLVASRRERTPTRKGGGLRCAGSVVMDAQGVGRHPYLLLLHDRVQGRHRSPSRIFSIPG